ncbi:conserved hypothethical protein [Ralstonia solanacearum PSI07]|nr:conserved hypothethical protein [Ralstonia solanacearum PSI07]
MRGCDNAREISCDEHEQARARYDFDMRIDTSRTHDARVRRDARVSVDGEDGRTNTCASTRRKSHAAHRAKPDVSIVSMTRPPRIVISRTTWRSPHGIVRASMTRRSAFASVGQQASLQHRGARGQAA